ESAKTAEIAHEHFIWRSSSSRVARRALRSCPLWLPRSRTGSPLAGSWQRVGRAHPARLSQALAPETACKRRRALGLRRTGKLSKLLGYVHLERDIHQINLREPSLDSALETIRAYPSFLGKPQRSREQKEQAPFPVPVYYLRRQSMGDPCPVV